MSVPKDNNNGVEVGRKGQRGAEPCLHIGTINNMALLSISKYAITPNTVIHSQIPKTAGIRSSFCYLLMVIISVHPRHTMAYYDDVLGTTFEVVRKAVRYLIRLGYVREVSSPRLIIPLNSYIIDNCYILTPLGRSVLNKLLDY